MIIIRTLPGESSSARPVGSVHRGFMLCLQETVSVGPRAEQEPSTRRPSGVLNHH